MFAQDKNDLMDYFRERYASALFVLWRMGRQVFMQLRATCQKIVPSLNSCTFLQLSSSKQPVCRLGLDHGTCVHTVVGFQLVLEAELLPAAVTFVGLLPSVDAFVALQRALVPEAAPAELALVRMIPC